MEQADYDGLSSVTLSTTHFPVSIRLAETKGPHLGLVVRCCVLVERQLLI